MATAALLFKSRQKAALQKIGIRRYLTHKYMLINIGKMQIDESPN